MDILYNIYVCVSLSLSIYIYLSIYVYIYTYRNCSACPEKYLTKCKVRQIHFAGEFLIRLIILK